MGSTTTRLALPYPVAADNNNVPADMLALASALDQAAMYEQGVVGSLPVGTAKPNGYWYADTASGGHVYVNVGTGGGRAYRQVPALSAVGGNLVLPGNVSAVDVAASGDVTVGDDLTVTDAATVGGTLGVTGLLQASDATYRHLRAEATVIPAGTTAGTRTLQTGTPGNTGLAGTLTDLLPFYFDPTRYAITGKTTKLYIAASLYSGNTSPGAVTFTVGLYPMGGPTAGSFVPGTVASGSTVAFASPGANAATQGNSGDFTVVGAGHYAFGVVLNATTAASSTVGIRAALLLRHV